MDIEHFRREYLYSGLQRTDLDADPVAQFKQWLQHTIQVGLQDATAMSIATVDRLARPWQRIVLLKDVDANGFVFYTNLGSRKAEHIAENASVSLLFPWNALDRQVKINGTATQLGRAEVARYFLTRPRDSQLAAWASEQSRPLSTRGILEAQFAAMKQKFSEGEVPLPDFWGGYRVEPSHIEFWQGRANRMHDRFLYTRGDLGGWTIERLAP